MSPVKPLPIHFHFLVPAFRLSHRTKLKKFIYAQIQMAGYEVDGINYIFCTDNHLLQINKQFLDHDTYTDIITFEYSQRSAPLLSDVYISTERVRENAQSFQSTFVQELHRVLFHGALHLIGYRDKTVRQTDQMRNAEATWLRKYFVPRETE